jgi:hypothetical protein
MAPVDLLIPGSRISSKNMEGEEIHMALMHRGLAMACGQEVKWGEGLIGSKPAETLRDVALRQSVCRNRNNRYK